MGTRRAAASKGSDWKPIEIIHAGRKYTGEYSVTRKRPKGITVPTVLVSSKYGMFAGWREPAESVEEAAKDMLDTLVEEWLLDKSNGVKRTCPFYVQSGFK